MLRNAATSRWPAGVIQAVYVFGSYARGATEPGDVDVAVTIRRTERWTRHFVDSLSEGTDPYTVLRLALRGRRRGASFVFDPHEGYDDIPMTLLWKRGESVGTALAGLVIPVDPTAGWVLSVADLADDAVTGIADVDLTVGRHSDGLICTVT